MAGTQLTQTRLPVITDAGTRFQISATCTLAGALPSVYVFLRQVVRSDDPKDDLFVRLASVTDFTNFGTSREACIADRTFIYRSNVFVQNYETITEANGAWKELSSRVSTLVMEYDAYINEFVTPAEGAVITYPTIDESVRTARIAEYETAADAVADLEDARDEHNAECQQKRYALETLQERLTECSADVAAVTPMAAAVGVSLPVLTSISTALDIARASAAASATALASSAEKTNILAQMNTIGVQLGLMNAEISALDSETYVPLLTFLGTLQTRLAALTAETNAQQVEVNQCQLEMAQVQAAVDTARAQRDAALAAVRAICPDYVPQ